MDIGIVHPGSMGAAVAHVAAANGHRVSRVSRGRSDATRMRAEGLADRDSVAALACTCDMVLSVVPPHGALQMASDLMACEFNDVYEKMNGDSKSGELTGMLSKLGEELAVRIELEDQLISEMLGRA